MFPCAAVSEQEGASGRIFKGGKDATIIDGFGGCRNRRGGAHAGPGWRQSGGCRADRSKSAEQRPMSDYKIGVKYQDGTAWLRGRVNNEEQMNAALVLASQTPGVTRVVNELTCRLKRSGSAGCTRASARSAGYGCHAALEPAACRSRSGDGRPGEARAGGTAGSRDYRRFRPEAAPRRSPGLRRACARFVCNGPGGNGVGRGTRREPKPIAPQRAKPIAKATRAPAQVAMQPAGSRPGGPEWRPDADVHGGLGCRPAWPRPATTSPACRTTLGQATRLTQTTPP